MTKPGLPNVPAKPLLGCKHDLTFQILDSTAQVTQILVSPFSGGAAIQSAVAPVGWTATTSAAGVEFKLLGGAPITVGSYTGFSITIDSTNAGQQYVLVEFQKLTGQTICGKPLFVPCTTAKLGPGAVAVVAGAPKYTGPACSCMNAYTAADENSFDFEDADIDEVTILQIVRAGYLKFNVDYKIEADPMPLNKKWVLASYDETSNETIVPIVPTTDAYDPATGLGQAKFTLTAPGDFDLTLVVTSALNCLHNPDAGREMEEEDTQQFRAEEMPSVIEVTPSDPCNHLKYVFEDVSDSVGDNPVWKVCQVGFAPLPVTLDSSGGYTFPTPGVSYEVHLVATDHETGVVREDVLLTITPAQSDTIDVKFKWNDYDSCPTNNFKVQFKNKTKGVKCPIQWKWNFGDNTAASADESPLHVYTNPGTYTVTLDANGSQTTKQITVAHWEPTIDPPVDCGDGTILWSTQDGTIPLGRKWTVTGNGGGEYNFMRRRSKKLRVCYTTTGVKEMMLWARNGDGGNCKTVKRLEITSIDRCCRRESAAQLFPFTANMKQYRMKTKFRFRGFPGRIYAKTKLQVLKGATIAIWRRAKADMISASFSGTAFTKSGDCLCMGSLTIPTTGDSKSKRAKVSKRLMPLAGTLRVKQGSLTSNHSVTIGGHTETQTLTLWDTDCKCGWTL
jgi:hypothetical protein